MSPIKYSSILAAAIIVTQSACLAQNAQWGSGRKWGAGANTTTKSPSMAETKLLYQNDNLVPTQNRTQAMRLEAETGHINPQVDAQLKPILDEQRKHNTPRVVKSTSVKFRTTRNAHVRRAR